MRQVNHGRSFRQLITLALLITVLIYMAADAVRGTHGLIARKLLDAKIAALNSELSSLKAQRTRLEHDAELLGPKAAAQPALLDEEARSLLDLAKPTDIVIVNDPSTAP